MDYKLYITIDTSGSMFKKDDKMEQVISSLKAIISSVDENTELIIRTFNEKTKKILEKKKGDTNMMELVAGLKASQGSGSALYDAWGQTINDIPLSNGDNFMCHIIIFTDGDESGSQLYSLKELKRLIISRIDGEMLQCSYIQAGPMTRTTKSIKTDVPDKKCKVYNVESNITGIEMAFEGIAYSIENQTTKKPQGEVLEESWYPKGDSSIYANGHISRSKVEEPLNLDSISLSNGRIQTYTQRPSPEEIRPASSKKKAPQPPPQSIRDSTPYPKEPPQSSKNNFVKRVKLKPVGNKEKPSKNPEVSNTLAKNLKERRERIADSTDSDSSAIWSTPI